MKRKMMSVNLNYSVPARTVLIFLMVGIVQSAPRPTAFNASPAAWSTPSTTQAETEGTLARSSYQDVDENFDMHLPSRLNFQRIPSHRSHDALKNLFENSRTTQDTHKAALPLTMTTANIIPETETIISRRTNELRWGETGDRANENFNDHYFDAATTRQSIVYDVGTTQYIGTTLKASSVSPSLSSYPEEVDSQATTFFIVKTTLPLPRNNPAFSTLHVASSKKDAVLSTTEAAQKKNEDPEGVINFGYNNVMRTENTPMNFHSSTVDLAISSTVSSTESEKTIKLSDGEKIDLKSTEAKATILTTTSATTVEQEKSSAFTTSTSRASALPQLTPETFSTPLSVVTSITNPTTIPEPPVVATNSFKYKNKINKGSGVKGVNSIPKKKSGTTMMGHDGVKVTRKKQLVEKSYRDDVETVVTTSGASEATEVEVERKENHIVIEPITTVGSTILTTSSIAPNTSDSVSIASWGGDGIRDIKPFFMNSTEKSTDNGKDETGAENELWNEENANKNYIVGSRPFGSMNMKIPTTERPSNNLINTTIVNSNESGTTLSLSSTISTSPESTETDSDPKTTTTSTNITEGISSVNSTTPPSAPITPKQTENDMASTFETTVELNNSATSFATVEVSITSSTMETQTYGPPSSTSLPRPKALYLNETNILVVEITSADNITDDMISREDAAYNGNTIPKFTIHNDGISEYDSGNTRPYGAGVEIDYENSKPQADDEIFVPDLKLEPIEEVSSVTRTAKDKVGAYREAADRDSDTIFYISNTEVKVVESKPTQNSSPVNPEKPSIELSANYDSRRPVSDSQYYPAIYEEDVIIDFPAKNVTFGVAPNQANPAGKDDDATSKSQIYEEDIILSPLKNNFDPLKIIANHNNNGNEQKRTSDFSDTATGIRHLNPLSLENNPSMTYIGEKLIEVEPSQTDSPITFPESSPNNSEAPLEVNESLVPISDVIIQPAIIPEMSIGVPVIGELPPQIELKEIDFLADSPMTGSLGGSSASNSMNDPNNEKFDGIQYGGDLFARDASVLTGGGGYDMDTEYVFGGRHHSYDNVNSYNSLNDPIKLNRDKYLDNERNMIPGYDGNNDVTVASKIYMHAVGNLQKDQLIAEVRNGFKELPNKHHMNSNGTGPAENLTNATAYSVMEEADGDMFNFTDMQTLFLACFATLVPLILCVLLAFGLRYLWRKYRPGPSVGGLMGDNSTDPLATKSMTTSQDELKSAESGFAINRSNDTLDSNDTVIDTKSDDRNRLAYRNAVINEGHDLTPNGMITSTSNHSGANGSVITMTLKNNHLIVETEERNDISRDARETKMHYTPSEKDGVFVVEVARGADSSAIPGSPRNIAESRPMNHLVDIEQTETTPKNDAKPTNHEEVQIHQPPRDGEGCDVNASIESTINNCSNFSFCAPEPISANFSTSNTGLSQSDLSTSSADSNKGYTYGNQQLYTIESKECRPVSPKMVVSTKASPITCENDENEMANESVTPVACKKSSAETKPIITAAMLKQDTVTEINDNHSKLNQKSQDNNGSKRQNGTEIFDTNNVPTPSNTSSHNNTEESLSSDYKNNELDSLNPPDGGGQHQIGNGKITHVIESNNGHHNEIKTVDEVHENGKENRQDAGTVEVNDVENGFDSIISLPPPPPSSDEIKQLNDVILMETNQLDSFPPPPPPVDSQSQILNHEVTTNGHSMEGHNGVALPVAITGSS